MFERGQVVMVRLRARDEPVEAEVVIDVGEETVVVDPYGDPARFRRVPRRAVSNGVPRKAPPAPSVITASVRRNLDDLTCVETARGWCATQAQAQRPTRGDIAVGVVMMCGAWEDSRSGPERRAPTCSRCRQALKMEANE